MARLDLLKQMSFGSQIAEDEVSALASYFVETTNGRRSRMVKSISFAARKALAKAPSTRCLQLGRMISLIVAFCWLQQKIPAARLYLKTW